MVSNCSSCPSPFFEKKKNNNKRERETSIPGHYYSFRSTSSVSKKSNRPRHNKKKVFFFFSSNNNNNTSKKKNNFTFHNFVLIHSFFPKRNDSRKTVLYITEVRIIISHWWKRWNKQIHHPKERKPEPSIFHGNDEFAGICCYPFFLLSSRLALFSFHDFMNDEQRSWGDIYYVGMRVAFMLLAAPI